MKRTTFEELLVASAKGMVRDGESKWMDARGQSGPAPSELGEHEPIPEEAVVLIEVDTENRKLKPRGDLLFPEGKEEA